MISKVNFRQQPCAFIRMVIHGLLTFLYFYTINEAMKLDLSVINLPTIKDLDKYIKFSVTYLTLCLLLGFFSLSTALDIAEMIPQPAAINKVHSIIRKLNDLFFISTSIPIAMCVSIVFWTGWILNSEDVYPEVMNNYIPKWINHMAHTAPIFISFFELLFVYHKTLTLKVSLTCLITTTTLYMLTLITLRVKNGTWAYYIIDVYVNTILKIIIMFSFFCYIMPIICSIFCRILNDYYWGTKYIKNANILSSNNKME
ncbi:androgen-dependent TFPI-regulating protein-like isoform X1 [Daktulosphaira vitifoliae]|uniref:androgen-dependent TFPI-regulating protein-like isoform X1 n=1 Tax=Daktulosphaira vitifoliae TaxID=58002 RepID=UPI0021AA3800|nr:androgen-dependent TFPI-regulating protein-like isoform X1 [Daktulosphaira vitifoliae]